MSTPCDHRWTFTGLASQYDGGRTLELDCTCHHCGRQRTIQYARSTGTPRLEPVDDGLAVNADEVVFLRVRA